ncbi:MAG: PQQ-binding-like beta-propeller repeat protein [Armatimonadetes bacterium]|nr:PQQ-binding-like beta-propeller repeat protein [Armatimonadota bacterium]
MTLSQAARTLERTGPDRHRVWNVDPEEIAGIDYPWTDAHFFVDPLQDQVFVGHQNRLFVLDANTGKPGAVRECDLSFASPWGESFDPKRKVVFEGDDRAITAMDLKSGKTLWSYPAPRGVMFGRTAPSLGPDGTVYAGTSSGSATVYALDGTTGKLKWKKDFPGIFDGRTAPAAGPRGEVYVGILGSEDTHPVYVLNASDGEAVRQIPLERKLTEEPTVGPDGTLFLGYWEGDLEARAPSGATKWSFEPPDGGSASMPALEPGGRLVVASRAGHIYGLDKAGKPSWTVDTGEEGLKSGAQVSPRGLLVVLDDDGQLDGLAPDAAAFQAQLARKTSDRPAGSIRKEGNQLYVGGIQLSIRGR